MALTAPHSGLDAPLRATCAVSWSVRTVGPLGPSGGGWTWGEVQGAANATLGRGGRFLGHPRSWRPGRGPQDSPGRLEAALSDGDMDGRRSGKWAVSGVVILAWSRGAPRFRHLAVI